ncbi:hypothetical protein AVEN_74454-1, partial [Araneus ventricosus]
DQKRQWGHNKVIQKLRTIVPHLQQSIAKFTTSDHLDNIVEKLQLEIFKACEVTYKIKKVKTAFNIRWWIKSKESKKKEIQAFNRRLHKTEGDEKQRFEIGFSERNAQLKKAAEKLKGTRSGTSALEAQTLSGCHTKPSSRLDILQQISSNFSITQLKEIIVPLHCLS